jgi:hypothetical protein
MNEIINRNKNRFMPVFEWMLAVFGAVVCFGVAFVFASYQKNDLWPIPGFYFIEMVALAVLGVISLLPHSGSTTSRWGMVPWIIAGAFFPLVLLGIFSIGIFLYPAMLAFLLVGVLNDIRKKTSMAPHIGWAVAAALIQGGLMYIFILVVQTA